jgi:hypothetical protein
LRRDSPGASPRLALAELPRAFRGVLAERGIALAIDHFGLGQFIGVRNLVRVGNLPALRCRQLLGAGRGLGPECLACLEVRVAQGLGAGGGLGAELGTGTGIALGLDLDFELGFGGVAPGLGLQASCLCFGAPALGHRAHVGAAGVAHRAHVAAGCRHRRGRTRTHARRGTAGACRAPLGIGLGCREASDRDCHEQRFLAHGTTSLALIGGTAWGSPATLLPEGCAPAEPIVAAAARASPFVAMRRSASIMPRSASPAGMKIT